MSIPSKYYIMETPEEALRLEVKTDPEAVLRQARWCGLKPGLRVLDAGCGPGKVTSILNRMIQPGGSILGIDFSEERIQHAKDHYGEEPGIDFQMSDVREPLDAIGSFDLIWVRFLLEYYRKGSTEILKNLVSHLTPGGVLCLLDLDHNCLNHYELPEHMEKALSQIMSTLENKYNFDAYAGRKLYSYLYDLGFLNIEVEVMPHHLIFGELSDSDAFNWAKKVEVTAQRSKIIFDDFPGGYNAFLNEFFRFFKDPRRFTYTPLILCKGIKS